MRSIDGRSLDLDDVIAVAREGELVRLAPAAAKRVDASRRALEKVVAKGTLAYGIKTGFGELANVAISDADVRALQLHLLPGPAPSEGRGAGRTPAPGEHARDGLLRRPSDPRDPPPGVPEPRRPSSDPVPRLARRERRPGSPGPHGPRPDWRRRRGGRRTGSARGEGARQGEPVPSRPAVQGRVGDHQRHVRDGRRRCLVGEGRPAIVEGRAGGRLHVLRSPEGLAEAVRRPAGRAEAATGRAGGRGEPPTSAEAKRDHPLPQGSSQGGPSGLHSTPRRRPCGSR